MSLASADVAYRAHGVAIEGDTTLISAVGDDGPNGEEALGALEGQFPGRLCNPLLRNQRPALVKPP